MPPQEQEYLRVLTLWGHLGGPIYVFFIFYFFFTENQLFYIVVFVITFGPLYMSGCACERERQRESGGVCAVVKKFFF